MLYADVSEHCLFHLHGQVGKLIIHTYPATNIEESVPKRRLLKFRNRANIFIYFGIHLYFSICQCFFEVCHLRCAI